MIEFAVPPGIVRVVTPDQVEDLTREGWRIVATGAEDRLITLHHREQPPPRTDGCQPYPSGHGELPLKSTQEQLRGALLFVMFRDEESVIRDLTAQLRTETEVTKRVGEARDRIVSENSKLEKQIEDLRTSLIGAENRNIDRERLHQNDREKLRKMESDLGAIRKALGEKQMKEILGDG